MANKGNVAIFGNNTKYIDISNYVNADSMDMQIWPWVDEKPEAGAQLQNKETPEADYQYFFWQEGTTQNRIREKFLLKRKFYQPVTTAEFDVRNLEECADGFVRYGDHQVWFRPEKHFWDEQKKKSQGVDDRVNAELEGVYADAEKLGVGVQTVVGGERKLLSKPRTRLYRN
jgi:hypothetical protein